MKGIALKYGIIILSLGLVAKIAMAMDACPQKTRYQVFMKDSGLRFMTAIDTQNLQVIEEFVDRVDEPFSSGELPLHRAATNGLELSVRKLLAMGACPCRVNPFGRTAGQIAEILGYTKIAGFLQEAETSYREQHPVPKNNCSIL